MLVKQKLFVPLQPQTKQEVWVDCKIDNLVC